MNRVGESEYIVTSIGMLCFLSYLVCSAKVAIKLFIIKLIDHFLQSDELAEFHFVTLL